MSFVPFRRPFVFYLFRCSFPPAPPPHRFCIPPASRGTPPPPRFPFINRTHYDPPARIIHVRISIPSVALSFYDRFVVGGFNAESASDSYSYGHLLCRRLSRTRNPGTNYRNACLLKKNRNPLKRRSLENFY